MRGAPYQGKQTMHLQTVSESELQQVEGGMIRQPRVEGISTPDSTSGSGYNIGFYWQNQLVFLP
jgi:bacteriocin-like protein